MSSRASIVCLALWAVCVRAQDSLWVDVSNQTASDFNLEMEPEEIEKRFTPELEKELLAAKEDALLLYTEYTGRAGADLRDFLSNVSVYADEAVRSAENAFVDNDVSSCRQKFDSRLRKIQNDAQRAASFSGENHHKFLLGHMIVFRMHLNKSEDYIKKCDKAIKQCGIHCETIPRVKRWRRLALEEIHRVRDDMNHSRRSYQDLVVHARRKLNHLRKQISQRTGEAVQQYLDCLQRG